MKSFFSAALLAISSVSFSQINAGLVVDSPFDGSINNLLATPVNSYSGVPSFITDGARCALKVDTTAYLNTGYQIASNNQFSFSFYFKLEKPNQLKYQRIILGRQPALALKNDTLQFIDWFSSNKLEYKLTMSAWCHVAFTFDGNNLNAYINSVSIGTYKLVNYFDAFMYIGNNNVFLIDDLRIYSRIISPSEITELYNLPSSCLTTSISENEMLDTESKKIVFVSDILGKEISDPSTFSGIMVMYYSDGSRKKRRNTIK